MLKLHCYIQSEQYANKKEGENSMKKSVLMFNTGRDGYTVRQCGSTMTVGELMEILDCYNEDMEIFYKNDEGYTYGYLEESRIVEELIDDND